VRGVRQMGLLTKGILMSTLATVAIAVSSIAVNAQTLWYRGYFDGEVTLRDGPGAGAYYRPSRPTTYPLYEAERFSDYLPCSTCGAYHRSGHYSPATGKVCKGNGTHLNPDVVYRRAPDLLPGQYYYEKQNHYNFRTPITAGWPYMKYEQRSEQSGPYNMGRLSEQRSGSRR